MQLDQEVEVLQHTVFTLQIQLKGYKDREAKAKAGDTISSDNNKDIQSNDDPKKDEIREKNDTSIPTTTSVSS